jgi:hypothetical protein
VINKNGGIENFKPNVLETNMRRVSGQLLRDKKSNKGLSSCLFIRRSDSETYRAGSSQENKHFYLELLSRPNNGHKRVVELSEDKKKNTRH